MQIIIKEHAYKKLCYYIDALDYEISGVGKAKYDRDSETWYVEDLRITRQEATAATASLEGEALLELINELHKEGEDLADWCLWWHSHNTMEAFWSGTDTGTMDANPFGGNFMLSIVSNNDRDFRARYDSYNPAHCYLDEIPVFIEEKIDEKLKEQIKKEVEEKVALPKPIKVAKYRKKDFDNDYKGKGFWDEDEYLDEDEYFRGYIYDKQPFDIKQEAQIIIDGIASDLEEFTEEENDLLDYLAIDYAREDKEILQKALTMSKEKEISTVLKKALELIKKEELEDEENFENSEFFRK